MSRRRRALVALARGLRGEPVTADWLAVLEFANEHLLAPALADAQAERLPTDVRRYLVTLRRLNGERNTALRRQAVELIEALNQRGIVPALLKGGLSLFAGPYEDPAERMMRDLDLLVPATARDDAIEVLQGLGYRLTQEYGATHHAFGDFARPGDAGSVDLHTELVDPSYVLPAVEVWRRGARCETGRARYVVPSPTDRALHNMLHAQIHHLGNFYRGELPLQQVHELTVLARYFGAAIDWAFIEDRMACHRLTTPLHSYLLFTHHLFGMPWPLAAPPSRAARLHCVRCQLQIGIPALRRLGVPWGNLRGALAWHRMRTLYGATGSALVWRCRHVVQYLHKKGVGAVVGRLKRVQ